MPAESPRSKGQRQKADDSYINEADHMVAEWVENDAVDNGLATATRAAESGKSHYVTAIIASYGATSEGQVNFKDGSTSLFTVDCYDNLVIPLEKPLEITKGNAVSAELDASGGAGNIGTITLIGYTA